MHSIKGSLFGISRYFRKKLQFYDMIWYYHMLYYAIHIDIYSILITIGVTKI